MTYGAPYLGSKSGIAKDIINALPDGKRLVDLFGGGFAISHCALDVGKYEKVLYNDVNPLIVNLVRDAIEGKYSYNVFTPRWISREEFHEKKNSDGYIKYCWSFGNTGEDYLYGRNIEDAKHELHDAVVYGVPYKGEVIEGESIRERRLNSKKIVTKRLDLERLQHLQHLEHLERLQITCADYRDYEYQNGDVVYCDIPYQNTASTRCGSYGANFNWDEFFRWAESMPCPVYVSSYEGAYDCPAIWSKEKRVILSSNDNRLKKKECLYKVGGD